MLTVKNRTGSNKDIHPGTTLVNRNPLRSSSASLIAILAAVFLLSGFGDISQEKKYECAGKSDNGMVSFREFPSLHFYGHRLKIAGSDIFSTYSYKICEESDTLVTFASQQEVCPAGHAEINSLKAAKGSFNKVFVVLELVGAQGLHGEYQCKEVAQK
jgi:hypothetical protein